MTIKGVDTKCYILSLFVRDDGERFLLGSGRYEFKNNQMHFSANAIQNDIVEVQGNDGYLLAGQVRRPGTQSFDGYVGDGTTSKEETEQYRRDFFAFFRKNFFYKVIYVFSDGSAIQRKRGFLVDDPTVKELYQQYPEYHVALNFEDVNYYSYSENDLGEEIYAKSATINLSSMVATGGLVWDNLGVVWEENRWGGEQVVSGSEITVNNELNGASPIDDVGIKGDTEQKAYTGKNLFDINGIQASDARCTASIDGNSIKITSTVKSTGFHAIVIPNSDALLGKTATISIGSVESTTAGRIYVYQSSQSAPISVGSSVSVIQSVPDAGASVTFTFPKNYDSDKDCFALLLYVGTSGGSTVVGNYTEYTDIQLELSSTVTDYEPYVGGIPSPNLDYPQDIQVVTGEQTVKVTGKNLCYKTQLQGSPNIRFYFNKPSSNTITISTIINVTTSNNSIYLLVDGASQGLAGLMTGGANERQVSTITFTDAQMQAIAQGTECYLLLYKSGASFTLPIDSQIEQGSTATAYEAYQSQSYTIDLGSIELCKIGDYQDYIYKSSDDWYVHKKVGKYILDGTESWTISTTQSNEETLLVLGGALTNPAVSSMLRLDTSRLRADHFSTFDVYSAGITKPGICTHFSSLIFRIPRAILSTEDVAGVKQWLDSNPTTVYVGGLKSPTDTKITDQALVGQLEALGVMKLWAGENNILVASTGTNLAGELNLKYYTTVTRTGAVWEEGSSGGPTVVSVDSITEVYPIWRVTGPAVDPQLSVLSTNTTIQYNGTVTSNKTLEIDMFNKTAKLNGTSVIGNVSGDWVNFNPGDNRVSYTTNNADAPASTIEWQEVVG